MHCLPFRIHRLLAFSGLIDLLLPFYYLPLKSKGTRLLPFGSSGSEVFVCDLDPEPTHHCVSGRFERGPLERIDFSINVRFGCYSGLGRERVKAQHALFRLHSVSAFLWVTVCPAHPGPLKPALGQVLFAPPENWQGGRCGWEEGQ